MDATVVTQSATIGYGAAFVAGLLSFFSPCVLPLVPVNIALISGVSIEAMLEGRRSALWPTVSRTLLFILGFSIVFSLLGAGAGAAGNFLSEYRGLIRILGGLALIVFGLHMTGLVPINALHRIGIRQTAGREFGAVGTVLIGMAFAVSWQPCIGPILAGILTLAAATGETWKAVRLLLVYSAGMGVPFLIAATAMGTFLKISARARKVMKWIEVGSGILLIALGLLLLADRMAVIAQFFASMNTPGMPDGPGISSTPAGG
jgi:cytochrome c-type biogenesis protein